MILHKVRCWRNRFEHYKILMALLCQLVLLEMVFIFTFLLEKKVKLVVNKKKEPNNRR